MLTCPICGNPVPDGVIFCPVCASPVGDFTPRETFCRNCGSPLDPATGACPACAAREAAPAPETPAAPAYPAAAFVPPVYAAPDPYGQQPYAEPDPYGQQPYTEPDPYGQQPYADPAYPPAGGYVPYNAAPRQDPAGDGGEEDNGRKGLLFGVIIAAVVLLIGLIVAAVLIFGGKGGSGKKDDEPASASGIADETTSEAPSSEPSSEPEESTTEAQTVTIPDFTGKVYSQIANDNYYSRYLKLSAVEEYSDAYPAGQIIGQSVKKGETLPYGSALQFRVSKGSEYVIIPKVTGMTYEQALETLKGKDYELIVVRATKMNPGSAKADTVESTIPAYGSRVKRGSTVQVVVWDTLAETTEAPTEPSTAAPEVRVSAVAIYSGGVNVTNGALVLEQGDTSYLTAVVTPDNAANKSVRWSSDNTSVVTVNSDGYLVARAAGSANITLTSVDGGYTAKTTVRVTAPEPVTEPTTAPPPVSVSKAYLSNVRTNGSMGSSARIAVVPGYVDGDTVTCSIMLYNCQGIKAADLILNYDSNVLELDYGSRGSDANAVGKSAKNSFSGEYNDLGGSVLVAFYFKYELYDQSEWDVNVNASAFEAMELVFTVKEPGSESAALSSLSCSQSVG
ncbi:MAG: PASTA domain-containing protein [Clostridia bacterium]|nr:PASTA domain-containing protein [Clostridia bacterium]